MKYINEFSIFLLLVLVVYSVLPGTVESRALETRNYIAEDERGTTTDDTAVRRRKEEIADFVEAYLSYRNIQNDSKRGQLNHDLHTLAASKRDWEDTVRETRSGNYRYPIDTSGGFLSNGVSSGTGR